jgi:hypothetical protein
VRKILLVHVGLRGSVLISNESSVVASYQWHAMEGVFPDIFSATHSSGSWHLLIILCHA